MSYNDFRKKILAIFCIGFYSAFIEGVFFLFVHVVTSTRIVLGQQVNYLIRSFQVILSCECICISCLVPPSLVIDGLLRICVVWFLIGVFERDI